MKKRDLIAAGPAMAILTSLLIGHSTGAIKVAVNTDPGMTRTSGCAVRLTDEGPYLHVNSAHECNGVKGVQVLANGDLKLTGLDGGPIIAMTCEEDETLTQSGISCGMSGGTGSAIARFYSSKTNAKIRADDPAVTHPLANIWLTFEHGLR